MPDDMDRATQLSEAWVERCLGARLRELHQPGAQDCQICGEPIPAARREKHPTARTCVPCQEQMEARRAR